MWFRRRQNKCNHGHSCPLDPADCPHADCPAHITLDLARMGSVVKVVMVSGRGRIAHRLMEMGFVTGSLVRVLRKAPLADPIEFEVKGYLISLRREEAALITVAPVISAPQTGFTREVA